MNASKLFKETQLYYMLYMYIVWGILSIVTYTLFIGYDIYVVKSEISDTVTDNHRYLDIEKDIKNSCCPKETINKFVDKESKTVYFINDNRYNHDTLIHIGGKLYLSSDNYYPVYIYSDIGVIDDMAIKFIYHYPLDYMMVLWNFLLIYLSSVIVAIFLSDRLLARFLMEHHIVLVNKGSRLISNNMSSLTANLNHNLNTPLSVVSSNISNMTHIYETYVIELNKLYIDKQNPTLDEVMSLLDTGSIKKNTDMAKTHLKGINRIMNRLSKLKVIRHSNGDKSYHDIITWAVDSMHDYGKVTYRYDIDTNLDKYSVGDKISNEEVMHIIIDHIKNALEANATEIKFSLHNTDKDMIYIRMSDNGNGIPLSILPMIFDYDVSGKKDDGIHSGYGLYASKNLLQRAKGDEYVVSTNDRGTVIEFKIPYVDKL